MTHSEAEPKLKIALLGPMQIELNGMPIMLAYDKVWALLAYLAVENGQPVRRDALATLLWPEQAQKHARHSLSQALLKLRQAVDPTGTLFVTDRHTVWFAPDERVVVDSAEVTAHLQFCRQHAHPTDPHACPTCMAKRAAAMALFRGDFLAGLSIPDVPLFDDWHRAQREQWHQQAVDLLTTLTLYFEKRGDLETAIAYARHQLRLEPWREETHRRLMLLLARSGQRGQALRQFEQCRATLHDELGVDVSAETLTLSNQIRLRANFNLHNLPATLTPFIGRAIECQTLGRWFNEEGVRLTTIAGIGGVGKTRLALAAARQCLDATTQQPADPFADGIYFVDLAPLSTPKQIVAALADALDLVLQSDLGRDPQQQLLDYLQPKHMLLILDNFEHLLTGAAIVADLLHGAPHLSLIATSRARLRLPGERVLSLLGLTYQPASANHALESDAAQLFVATAQQLVADQPFSPEDWVQVNRICELVEGIPLAVELAAQWIDTLSLADIVAELEAGLATLDLARSGLPARHRSMQAVFDSSWQRLPAAAQQVLADASIFQGGFSREAATSIVGATSQSLASLVSHSLLRYDPSDQRYHCHELLRQYAAVRLADDPTREHQVRQAHLSYFRQFAEQGEMQLRGGASALWMRRLRQEKGNWQAAFAWGFDHDLETAAQLAYHMILFWYSAGQVRTGQAWYERLLTRRSDLTPHTLGWVLTWTTAVLWVQGHFEESARLTEEAYEVFRVLDDGEGLFMVHYHRAIVAFHRGEQEAALRHTASAVALARSNPSISRYFLGIGIHLRSDFLAECGYEEESLQLARECQQLCQQTGDLITIAYSMDTMAGLLIRRGDLAKASDLCNRVLSIAQDLNDRRLEAIQYKTLGSIALERQDFGAAIRLLETGLAIGETISNADLQTNGAPLLGDGYRGAGQHEQAFDAYLRWGRLSQQQHHEANVAASIERLAQIRWQMWPGDAAAVRWVGAVAAWREKAGISAETSPLASQQSHLTEEQASAAWDLGRGLTLAECLAEAKAVASSI